MMWNFDSFGSRIALISDRGGQLSYSQLQKETEALAGIIGERCLAFSLCTNTVGSVVGYTAFLNHGIVPLLLNAALDGALLHALMETYAPAYLWLPQAQAMQFPDFQAVYAAWDYVLLKTGYGKAYPLHPDLALLLTTSGSTGSPKLVRQTYENIRTNTEQIVEYLALDETERPVTTLPMNYTYGCSILNTHLRVGATILLTDCTLMQREFWNFMREQRATSFGGVPYTYEMLEKLRFFRMNLPDLRTMTQAGGKLSPELHRKFAAYAMETGKHFVVMYGACEATARMGYLPPEKALEKAGSMGIAIPAGRFTLVDTDGSIITEAETSGELVYEGKNVTMGYAVCGDDLCKGDERHGVLHTGDIAQRDADGYYYIVGRLKRFLKVYGNRVNMDELERMSKEWLADNDCAVSGRDDAICLFLTAQHAEKAEALRHFLAGKTGLNPAAFHTAVLPQIPKNDAGKVLYRELEAYLNQ